MREIGTFLLAVMDSWAGYMTGGLIVAFFALWSVWKDRPVPRTAALALAAVFLLMAFYKAWHDEYVQNEGGRSVGLLAFEGFSGELNRSEGVAHPQLQLSFRNISTRLLKFHVEDVRVDIDGHANEQIYVSRDAYVYAGQPATYRLDPVRDVPLAAEPLKGTLEYKISYTVQGGRKVHRTEKKISFDLYWNEPLGGKFSVLEEREE